MTAISVFIKSHRHEWYDAGTTCNVENQFTNLVNCFTSVLFLPDESRCKI